MRLYGGNDGINTVYPVDGTQRSSYETFRPTLALPSTNAQMQPWFDAGFGSSTVLDIGTNTSLDLSDAFTDDAKVKVRGLAALVLQSAEQQVY